MMPFEAFQPILLVILKPICGYFYHIHFPGPVPRGTSHDFDRHPLL